MGSMLARCREREILSLFFLFFLSSVTFPHAFSFPQMQLLQGFSGE